MTELLSSQAISLRYLKSYSPLNQQISHRARRIARDLSKISGSRIEVRHIHLRAVGRIERIHLELERNRLPDLESSLYVGVQPVQSVRANPVHPLRKNSRLKSRRLFRWSSLEPAGVKPLVKCSRSGADTAQVSSVIEDGIVPIEQ